MNLIHRHPARPWRDVARAFSACRPGQAWIPAFDIEETDSAYVLRGDVPDTSRKDIEIRIDESVLSIRGERRIADARMRIRRSEREHGPFVRRFRLPCEVDEEGVEAAFSDGVLEVRLPKREPVDRSRRIPVR